MAKTVIDPATLDGKSVYKIMAGSIVPRPIALTSTISAEGVLNLAPFSFFNMLAHQPPLVSLSIMFSAVRGTRKDTLANIEHTREFVVNLVGQHIVEAQNRCASDYPAGVNEFEVSGLTPIAATTVRPPLVKESLVNFECRLEQTHPLPESTSQLVIGRICMMHFDSKVLQPDGRISLKALNPVGRLAGNAYCHVTESFSLSYDSFERVQG